MLSRHTKTRACRPRQRGSILCRTEICFSSPNGKNPHSRLLTRYYGLSHRLKRSAIHADHSLPLSAYVTNAWSYTSTPSIFLSRGATWSHAGLKFIQYQMSNSHEWKIWIDVEGSGPTQNLSNFLSKTEKKNTNLCPGQDSNTGASYYHARDSDVRCPLLKTKFRVINSAFQRWCNNMQRATNVTPEQPDAYETGVLLGHTWANILRIHRNPVCFSATAEAPQVAARLNAPVLTNGTLSTLWLFRYRFWPFVAPPAAPHPCHTAAGDILSINVPFPRAYSVAQFLQTGSICVVCYSFWRFLFPHNE